MRIASLAAWLCNAGAYSERKDKFDEAGCDGFDLALVAPVAAQAADTGAVAAATVAKVPRRYADQDIVANGRARR
jgi:hypothetical protein